MASRTIVELTDDLDGGKAAETVSFGLDGRTYEIDLSVRNAKALRAAVDQYIVAARRAPGARVRRASVSSGSGYDPAAVRAWASSNKIKVSPRGRIKAEVLERYRSAGN
jgi:hypothetical protein